MNRHTLLPRSLNIISTSKMLPYCYVTGKRVLLVLDEWNILNKIFNVQRAKMFIVSETLSCNR